MRIILILFCVCLLTASNFAQTILPTSKWILFTSTDGEFSAKYPGKPKTESYPDEITQGALIHRHSLPVANSLFSVATIQMPEITPQIESQVIELVGMEYIEKIKGKLISTKDITQGLCRGKEFTATFAKSATARLRTFAAGDRAYYAVFLSTDLKASEPVAEYFLDSFQITKKCFSDPKK